MPQAAHFGCLNDFSTRRCIILRDATRWILFTRKSRDRIVMIAGALKENESQFSVAFSLKLATLWLERRGLFQDFCRVLHHARQSQPSRTHFT
jgi:hypothetical protein